MYIALKQRLKKSLMLYKRGNEIPLSINRPSDIDDTIKTPKYTVDRKLLVCVWCVHVCKLPCPPFPLRSTCPQVGGWRGRCCSGTACVFSNRQKETHSFSGVGMRRTANLPKLCQELFLHVDCNYRKAAEQRNPKYQSYCLETLDVFLWVLL